MLGRSDSGRRQGEPLPDCFPTPVSRPASLGVPALSFPHDIMALVLRSQKAGPQPPQEKTDVTRNATGTFFPALAARLSPLGRVRTPRRRPWLSVSGHNSDPETVSSSSVALVRPHPRPGPTWGEGGGVTEGGSGLRGAAGCRGARRAREPRGHDAGLTATRHVWPSPAAASLIRHLHRVLVLSVP